MMKMRLCCLGFVLWMAQGAAWAFEPFVAKHVHYHGLRHVSAKTVSHYLPVTVGSNVTEALTDKAIQALYGTGFFEDIQIKKDGDALLLTFKERPLITALTVTGNQLIDSDRMTSLLKDQGLAEGRFFSRPRLATVVNVLRREYEHTGRYGVSIKTKVKPLPHDRMAVTVTIDEGHVAIIRSIDIKGAHAFSKHTLLSEWTSTTPGLFTFFTRNDRYSPEQWAQDLEAMRNFYLNHGFLKYQQVSKKAQFSKDKQFVDLHVEVKEGQVYHITGFAFEGASELSEETLKACLAFETGDRFSRRAVLETESAVGQKLGAKGFIFTDMQVEPVIDDVKHTVFLRFHVIPGVAQYVRFIHFSGHAKTKDAVLRRAFSQLEGSLLNMDKLQDSLRRLNMSGFLKGVQQKIVPVPGQKDQVDLNVHVTEVPSVNASLAFGWSTTDHMLITAGISQQNFMGTGNDLAFNIDKTASSRTYSLSYDNPYYTLDGVSRGFNLYFRKNDPKKVNLGSYSYDSYGGNLRYGIPLTTRDRIGVSVGYQQMKLMLGEHAPVFAEDFVTTEGSLFREAQLSVSWVHNTWDQRIFPTRGVEHDLGIEFSLPIGHDSLNFYRAHYQWQWFKPLGVKAHYIFMSRAGVLYGDGLGKTETLPFFKNYFSGGIEADAPVAGFQGNSLGPRDVNGHLMGGNLGTFGRLGLILPEWKENVRTMAFVDAGNVYNTAGDRGGFSTSTLRYSAGVSFEWRTPMGPLVFSFARALKHFNGDVTRTFEFTIGAHF